MADKELVADDFREQPVFLSTVPAERSDHRGALIVVVLSLLIFGATVPFARTQLPQIWAFVPIYQSALTINDLITAVLLYAQFAILRSRALLVLASGYLFTAVFAAVHMLTFPGLFSPTGLLGAGPQTTAWLYMFWHSGFPLAVVAYALMKDRIGEPKRPSRPFGPAPILSSAASVLAIACLLTLLATTGQEFLPSVMRSNSYSPIQVVVSGTVWMFSVAALLVLWMRRPHSKLDLWLIAVMWAWIFDVALSAVFNAGRFDLGFYAGRIYGVLAATFVLLVLLLEMNAVYARFARSLWAEREERKREIEERRNFFETSLDLIFVADSRGNLVRVSPSCAGILGYQPQEMIGRSAREFIYADDLESTRNEMRSARHGQKPNIFEARYVHKSGRIVSLAWSGAWSEPVHRYFFIGRDMTERKASEDRLNHLAHHDQLTGLLNRISLESALKALLEPGTGRERQPSAIAMLDLDRFKDINDTLGHSIGDHVLKEVAQRLTAFTADGGRVYRFGGDEFVVTFPDCDDPGAVTQAVDGMLARLSERYEVDGRLLFVGASGGIAISPADGSNVEVLLANADLALYEAKAHGGRTCRLFVPAFRARAEARQELDLELRRAFSEEEFELYFQPQIRLADGAAVGAEALLRWRHPERGILAADAFIEVLAESVIAREVGRWILRSACEKAAAWRYKGLPLVRIGVNLFPAQFHHETLLHDIEHTLLQTGLPADALELEITEKIGLDNDERILARLQAVRKMGAQFAFDDFGTGYASLSYLSRYPLTRIKIDQSFVKKISDNGQDTAIVRSVIILAHNLGLAVIAEGVETLDQAGFLHAQGCEEVQGFLCAGALPQAEFEEFLRSHQIGSREAANFVRSILPTSLQRLSP
jgi:diguanylate cyclase (GGDEF)-like protein/PAS domain S-box-containing protein